MSHIKDYFYQSELNFDKNIKYVHRMKFFSTIPFILFATHTVAQCPVINLKTYWDGDFITLKWQCQPKTTAGVFNIYRTCLSLKKDTEQWVAQVEAHKRHEYADANKQLRGRLTYQYRIQYTNGNTKTYCSVVAKTKARAVDSDSTDTTFLRKFEDFKQREIANLKPTVFKVKPFTNLRIAIEIKDFNFTFSDKMYYAIVNGNEVIKTRSKEDLQDFRFVDIFLPNDPALQKRIRIALIQGDSILGLSDFIDLNE
jgi:hypothetical protein